MFIVIHKRQKLKCFGVTSQKPLYLPLFWQICLQFSFLIANKLCIVDVKFPQNQMLYVRVTQMYSNREVYLCNAILVTEIFCYRYFSAFSRIAAHKNALDLITHFFEYYTTHFVLNLHCMQLTFFGVINLSKRAK